MSCFPPSPTPCTDQLRALTFLSHALDNHNHATHTYPSIALHVSLGPAGTGKTVDLLYICKHLLDEFASHPSAIALTASTGIAASAIGGVTFHSYFGLGSSGGVGALHRWSHWQRLKVLIIDEVCSVCSPK